MEIYVIMIIVTFVCLSLYYKKRDEEFLNSIEDYEGMFLEVAIESVMWIICVPIIVLFGIIHSVSVIKREHRNSKRRNSFHD